MEIVENLSEKNIDSILMDVQDQKDAILIKVKEEKLKLLHVNLLYSLPSNFVNTTIVFIALYLVNNSELVWSWYIASLCMFLLRYFEYFFYKLNPQYKFNDVIFTVGIILSSCLWGFVGSFLIPKDNLLDQMIVISILVGMVSGGIQTLQGNLLASCTWIIVLLLPLNVWLYLQSNLTYLILAFSLTSYIFFMIITAWRANRLLTKALILHYVNMELFKNTAEAYKQLEENEERLSTIQENAPIGMAIISLDGKFLHVNNALSDILGYRKSELEHLNIQDIIYPEDKIIDLNYEKRILDSSHHSFQYEIRLIHKNNQLIWVLKNRSLIQDKNNQPSYFIAQFLDITEQKNNDKKMLALNEETKIMLDNLQQHENDMVLTTKMNTMLQTCNEAREAYLIVSLSAQKLFKNLSGGLSIFNLSNNSMQTVEQWGTDQILMSSFSVDDCWALREGHTYMIDDPHKDLTCSHYKGIPEKSICLPLIVQNGIIGILHLHSSEKKIISPYQQQLADSFNDVIRLALANLQLRQELQSQATRDPLTGLYNRRYLHDTLSRELQLAMRNKNTLCVAMIDLDHFKYFNDSYGHNAGDKVLKSLSEHLNLYFRGTDIVCRYGGEEFIVVMINNQINDAFLRLDQFRNQIRKEHIGVNGNSYPFPTISVGIAEAPRNGINEDDIIKAADKALYAAKNHGRNCVELYEQ